MIEGLFRLSESSAGHSDKSRARLIECCEINAKSVLDDLFLVQVDKVIVGERLRFILRDGTEWVT